MTKPHLDKKTGKWEIPLRCWYWCPSCKVVAVQCEYCKLGSCSGGGCDKCHDMFEAIMYGRLNYKPTYMELKLAGLIPKKKKPSEMNENERILWEIFGSKNEEEDE